ncbi:MAG: hypothetical protein GY821_10060 [Gammaproteobacteria bacterium]|nr:hypothetical protein [Gammaproteobacteria bacterium]
MFGIKNEFRKLLYINGNSTFNGDFYAGIKRLWIKVTVTEERVRLRKQHAEMSNELQIWIAPCIETKNTGRVEQKAQHKIELLQQLQCCIPMKLKSGTI